MKIKQVTFENVHQLYYLIVILQPEKVDNNYIFTLKNKKIFKIVVKNIVKLLISEKVRLLFLSDYIEILERICKEIKLKDIIDKFKNYESTEKKETDLKPIVDKQDFTRTFIDGFYNNFIHFQYISYKEFLDIRFLDYEEIIATITKKSIYEKMELMSLISAGNHGGDFAVKLQNDYKNTIDKLNEVGFDRKAFEQKLDEVLK